MAGGNCYTYTEGTNTIKFTGYWTASRDIPNNRSAVTVWGHLYRSSDYDTYDTANVHRLRVKVEGVTKVDYSDFEFWVETPYNGKDGYLHRGSSTGTYQFSFYISHDTDGTFEDKSMQFIFTAGDDVGSYIDEGVDVTANDTVTFDAIPRGSVIGSISAFNIEDEFSVPITKYSATFEDTLVIKYGSTTIKTISDYEDEDAINLSDTEILTAYNALWSNMSGTFTFEITTKSGSTTIGTDSETATGTAKGTMYLNNGGTWERAVPHLNVDGTWKRCIAYVNISGTWKRCKG